MSARTDTPSRRNKNLTEPQTSTLRQEHIQLDPTRSQTPIPRSKPKLLERIKGFLLPKKSRHSIKPLTVDPAESAGSSGAALHVIQKGGPAQFYPPLPIVVDPPEHQVPSDAPAQDPARNQPIVPNLASVDAERKAAIAAIDKMNTLSGQFEKATLTVSQSDDLVSSLLKSLERFNSIVDGIAGIHPFSKAAWSILSLAAKKIIDQKNLDISICSLLTKMNEAYVSLTKTELSDIHFMKEVVERISRQTLECSYFIREYAQNENFRTRFLKNLVSGTDERVQTYNEVFDELRQQFLERATGDTLVVVHRIWKGVENLAQDVDLNSMPYVRGAGLNTQKTCLEGTRREILDEITSWANRTEDNTPRVFWLHGNAGTGKSFISHTIANRFKKIGRLGSCFCFDRNEMAQQRDKVIFSMIARDLADRDEHMRKALMDAIRRDTSLKNTMDILQQWKEMILKPTQRLSKEMVGPIVIIIDALDESGTEESRNHLLSILAGKVNDQESYITKLPSHIRILVTSRTLPDISRAFHCVEHVQQKSMDSIPRASSDRDILRFILRELSDVEEMNSQDASTLTRTSDGLFEWARLACEFIKRLNDAGVNARDRFEIVVTSSTDGLVGLLDSMYKLTLKSIFPEDSIIPRSTRLTLFRSVMAQIIGTTEPLPLSSLKSMRRYFANKDLREIDVEFIIKPLGALLSGTTDPSPVRPLHVSFPEFLSDRNRSGEFFTNLSGIHDELVFACLGVMKAELRFNICQLPSSYLPNSKVGDLAERIQENITPQLSYSCRFWADHLRHTSFTSHLAKEVQDFFDERLLFWIEVLSLEKKISTICTALLSFVIEWSMLQPEGKDICDAAADAQMFIWTFGGAISLSTPHLYMSAVPFSPKNSCISRKMGGQFGKVLKVSEGRNEVWPVIGNVLYGHYDAVVYVAFSPDGKHIVSGSLDKTIWLWNAETGEQLRPLGDHNLLEAVAFSPDGKRIASGSGDKTIRLWDVETGELLRPFEGHEGWVESVAYSTDGKRIASGSRDKTIRLWDVETGELLRPPLEGHQDWVMSLAFSPDGKRIMSGSGDKTIRMWDAETGKQLRVLDGHQDWIVSLAFSPDGKCIASGSGDKTIRLWDVETGELLRPPFQGHQDGVCSVAFSPDGKRIASGSDDRTIRLWSAEMGDQLQPPLEGHQDPVWSVAFSPDGKRIVSGSVDKTIRLWDSETGMLLRPTLERCLDWVESVAFSPDGERIVSESPDKTILLWGPEIQTEEPLRPPLEGHHNVVCSVAFSSDAKHIVSGSGDTTIRLWDAETGKQLRSPLEGHQDWVWSVVFSPDGKRIVSGSGDKTIRLWDVETGEQLLPPLEGHQDWVYSVVFSPDGKRIVSGSRDKTISLWDAETGQLLSFLGGHQDAVWSVACSLDGKHIVSGSQDKTIRLWDAETGEQLRPLEGHRDGVCSVAFSPDGKCILSGSADKTIRLWDSETGEQLRPPLEGHQDWVECVMFSSDGNCIVSGSRDKTIRLWDAETGQQLQPFLEGHQEWVASVAFSANGKRIVSASDDRTIRLWSAEPLEGHQDSVSSVVFSDGKCNVSDFEDKAKIELKLKQLQHLIRFSLQLEHGLSEPVEFLDQISSSQNGLVDVTSSGWVQFGLMSKLLFWSPPTYNPRWFSPSTQMIIPVPDVQLDLSNMAHGSLWHLCYNLQ